MNNTLKSGIYRRTILNHTDWDNTELLQSLGIYHGAETWLHRKLRGPVKRFYVEDRPGPWHSDYVIVLESIAAARVLLPLLTAEGVAKRITLAVKIQGTDYGPDIFTSPIWGPAIYPKVFKIGSPYTHDVIQISGKTWKSIHECVQSFVGTSLGDRRTLSLGGLRSGLTDSSFASWVVADPLARAVAEGTQPHESPIVDSVDVVFTQQKNRSCLIAKDLSGDITTIDISQQLPPIDPVIFSPTGFNPFASRNDAELRPDGAGNRWIITHNHTTIVEPFIMLDESIIARLRLYRRLKIVKDCFGNSTAISILISQLAVSGIPIDCEYLPSQAARLLGKNISSLILREESDDEDPKNHEAYSIELRRAALKDFLPSRLFSRLGIGRQGIEHRLPTVSILLPTRRPNLIPIILEQISRQTYPEIELILAIHGDEALTNEVQNAIEDFPGDLVHRSFASSETFGSVLNHAVDAASGELVAKMDDDDWYSRHHIDDLVLAREYSGAQLIGSPVEFTYLAGLDITTRRNHTGEQFTDHIAGGTMMLSRSDLLDFGGWRPVSNAVDRGLIDVVRSAGGRVYRTHGQNYVMHRRSPDQEFRHTWETGYSVFLRDIRDQWSGLVLPPSFGERISREHRYVRQDQYRSFLSGMRQNVDKDRAEQQL